METVTYPMVIRKTATILTGQATSDVVDIRNARNIAFILPATWTTAGITFQACDSADGTFVDLKNDAGTEVAITAAQNTAIVLNTALMAVTAMPYIKIRSGTSSSPTNQSATRLIKVIYKT
jgi:hypothetical protein